LRYPGHISLIQALKQSGFFSEEPLNIGGTSIKPLDFTSKILFDEWRFASDEKDFTVLKIILQGKRNGSNETVKFYLLDRYDETTDISSMSRTTGYTCTATANLLAKGLFTEKGVFPPERVGNYEDCYNFVLQYLEERGLTIKKEAAV